MMEKVYRVTFMEYTNYMCDTVSDKNKDIAKIKYLHVGKEPYLVRDSELEKYRKFGNGYRSIDFVGYMDFDEE